MHREAEKGGAVVGGLVCGGTRVFKMRDITYYYMLMELFTGEGKTDM